MRYVRFFIRRIGRKLQNFSKQILWKLPISREGFDGVCHLLIVKNPIYVSLAKICVESFLFWNKNSNFVLHVDSITEMDTKRVFWKLIRRNKVIIRSINTPMETWQKNKLITILNMSGTRDIFMDADLRWNGSLPNLEGITLFHKEYLLHEKSEYTFLVKELDSKKDWSSKRMLNTSFVTFSSKTIKTETRNAIDFYFAMVNNHSDKLEENQKSSRLQLLRIAEQLAISLALQDDFYEINFLKLQDGHRDGSMAESSYFGATGVTF